MEQGARARETPLQGQSRAAGRNYAATRPAPQETPGREGPPPVARLMELLGGAFVAQGISVAARLGVADVLAQGAASASEVAAAVHADGPTLYRLLRALGDVGVVVEVEPGRFTLGELGQPLRSDVADSVRGYATMIGMPFHRGGWTGLYDAVRTGEPAFARVHGVDLFAYLAANPDDAAVFTAAMRDISANFLVSVLDAVDVRRFATIVDVGGGNGTFLAAALGASPASRGVLLDTAPVVAGARPLLEAAGVADRCDLVAGDFFSTVPAGGDLYVLANVLHDWDDTAAVRILRTCRAAMDARAILLIVELVLPGDTSPSLAKLYDLEMLAVTPNGRHRTEAGYRSLAEAAGLRVTAAVPTRPGTPASYVQAQPV